MISINFTSSKDNDEKRLMHSKSEKIEIMIKDKTEKLLKTLFNILLLDIKLT